MEHLNPMIYDLSIILILAGITSVLFRIMKQPVVLGYIAVGMLAGSGFLPFFSNLNDIQVWAEIGIIFLLFTLGLEFSFKKLMKVGSSAVIAAIVIIAGMMSTGVFLATFYLKWNLINSLFLGGMLCMSSTTIIYKAFKDMGVLKRDYTTLVFGILIVEDLFAIVLM
ncbi:MAG: cation:proton antiporter, partial [Bacteroidales bacterium]